MQILFAKCIGNQHSLISILSSYLLIWLEGKNADQTAFYPLAKQQIGILPPPSLARRPIWLVIVSSTQLLVNKDFFRME